VVKRVVADLESLPDHLAKQLGAARHLLADHEEGPLDLAIAQDLHDGRGVTARTIVEGEGNALVLA
jgi:hypothetical protein